MRRDETLAPCHRRGGLRHPLYPAPELRHTLLIRIERHTLIPVYRHKHIRMRHVGHTLLAQTQATRHTYDHQHGNRQSHLPRMRQRGGKHTVVDPLNQRHTSILPMLHPYPLPLEKHAEIDRNHEHRHSQR